VVSCAETGKKRSLSCSQQLLRQLVVAYYMCSGGQVQGGREAFEAVQAEGQGWAEWCGEGEALLCPAVQWCSCSGAAVQCCCCRTVLVLLLLLLVLLLLLLLLLLLPVLPVLPYSVAGAGAGAAGAAGAAAAAVD
jgi:hypothetical protein